MQWFRLTTRTTPIPLQPEGDLSATAQWYEDEGMEESLLPSPTSNFKLDVPHALRRALGLVANLSLATSQAQVIGLLSTYVLASGSTQTWTDIFSYLKENVLDTYAEPQSPMIALPDWLQALKSYQMNWKDLAQGATKVKLEQFLGILVAFNLCEAANVTFQLGRFMLFKPTDLKSIDVFTIFDVMFEIGVYFIEVGYCSWKMKAPRLLFLGVSGYDIDIEFAQLREYWKYYELGNLAQQIKISEASYYQRLNALHNNLSAALKQTTNPPERNMIAARRSYIGGLLCTFDQKRLGGAPKVKPLMLSLYGESSIGKSPMMDVIIQTLLTSRGHSNDPSLVYTRDSRVKYWDGCRSDMLAVKLDDPTFSKDMSENFFADDMRIIGNNQATAVNMSYVEDKGRVVPCFQLAVTSTNSKHLRASEISYCPWSFQRRNDFVLTVVVRPEFRVDGDGKELDRTKVAAFYDGQDPPFIEDLWFITVEKPVRPKKKDYNCKYEVMEYRGQKLQGVSLEMVIQFLIEKYNDHMDWQEGLVVQMNNRTSNLKTCPEEGCRHIKGHCPDHRYVYDSDSDADDNEEDAQCYTTDSELAVPEFGLYDATKWIAQRSLGGILSKKEASERRLSLMLVCQFERIFYTYEYLQLLPTWVCELPGFHLTMACIDTWGFSKTYTKEMTKLFMLAIILSYFLRKLVGPLVYPVMIFFMLYRMRYYSEHALNVYRQQLLRRNRCFTVIEQRQRDMFANAAIMASAAIAAMYLVFKGRRLWKETKGLWNEIVGPFSVKDNDDVPSVENSDSDSVPLEEEKEVNLAEAHGSFEPEVIADILQRDAAYNDWGEVTIRPVPVSDKCKTMSHDDLVKRVEKHLRYCQLVSPKGEKLMVQLLIVTTGYVILPQHYFHLYDSYEATGFRDEPLKSGGRLATRLSKQRSVLIPDSDLCICAIDSGGAVSGLLDMFAIGEIANCPFTLVRRLKDGTIKRHKGRGSSGRGAHTLMKDFQALRYEYLDTTSCGGWCGSPLISEGKHPSIVGIHVAGSDFNYSGYACTLTREQIMQALIELRKIPGSIHLANSVATPNMGELKYTSTLPHVKSPLWYQPKEAQYSYHGNTGKHVRPKHQVRKTPISKTVAEVFEIEDTTRPPEITPNWKGIQKTLSAAAIPGLPHEHHLIIKAAEDYVAKGKEIFKKDIFCHTRPLTEKETINGIPGVKFIDSLNVSTSAHPWSGTKLDHMEGEPGNRHFNAEITEKWHAAKEMLKEGSRLGLTSKTCLKSEAYWKDKCRYFFVSHLILTMLVREYFLPLIRVMQLNPFVFECAVGLNAHGPDWDALHEHVFKYGRERLIGGDYREYDTRIPAQGLQYAFWCLIEFAKCCDYSEEDIRVMEAMCVDLIYPIIDVNGDLVSLSEGTHVSGNSLTVILNGIVGSLNMRCFFFSQYPDSNFRECVSLITYGDDNAGSVKDGYEKFNIENFANYLSGIGQIYTMPDKEQELQPYLDPEDFEFLKRNSVYHPELGVKIGALQPKSMLKSLLSHNYDKNNPLSPMETTTQAMESFVIECFNHGPAFHADYVEKLRTVAAKHDITHMVRNINSDYASCVEEWKNKYTPHKADRDSA